jgi:hypothetical protein
VLFLAAFSALGTLAYGYRFAAYYFSHAMLRVPLGILLAVIGAGANIILGVFSLLKINTGPIKYPYSLMILVVCIFSAIPTGCICFFGYQDVISSETNIILSCIVTVVNTAINYTAIQIFIDDMRRIKNNKIRLISNQFKKTTLSSLGYLIGILVALAPFLAATAGVNDILLNYKLEDLYKNNIGIMVGIFSFIPLVCLYGYTNKIILLNIFEWFKEARGKNMQINIYFFIIVLFCILAGTALAQIMREFLMPEKNIPALFKTDFMRSVSPFLIFVAWFSSAGTTFYCIRDLLKKHGYF